MSRRGALVLALSALLLTGCFTGKRPHFTDTSTPFPAGSTTGDAAIDAVLSKLDAPTAGPATAAYSVLTKYKMLNSQAVVVLDGGSRSVTIGNIHYIQTAAANATCTVDGTVPCTATLDAARVSDIGLTFDFYASDTAKRLRRDAQAKIGPTTAHAETIANQPAQCVDVPLSGGVAVYCVMNNGLIAKLDDGDIAVNLTIYGDVSDPNQFVIPNT